MNITAAHLAEKVQGVVEGDGAVMLTGVAGIRDAEPGDLTFLANRKYAPLVAETKAGAIIAGDDLEKGAAKCAVIRVKNPDKAFTVAALLLGLPAVTREPGVHPSAVIAPGVQLGTGVCIGPHCVLEPGVAIGENTVICAGVYIGHGSSVGRDGLIYPCVVIRERSKIGRRVIVHSGTVIGSDGFGYYREGEKYKKIPQMGIVEIGDDVEIGANAAIDRARFGKTVIEDGVKIDNLVQIAHNVRVGANTVMAAQAGISGSTVIGRNVQFGGQAGVAGHLNIEDNVVVGARGGVTKDIEKNTYVMGFPAMPHEKAKRLHAHTMRLPELRDRVTALEKRLAALENKEKRG
jgi:UDP-3-O-[3-hydroxymyristoyl] glucosamine N-acyltransferase